MTLTLKEEHRNNPEVQKQLKIIESAENTELFWKAVFAFSLLFIMADGFVYQARLIQSIPYLGELSDKQTFIINLCAMVALPIFDIWVLLQPLSQVMAKKDAAEAAINKVVTQAKKNMLESQSSKVPDPGIETYKSKNKRKKDQPSYKKLHGRKK